MCRVARLPSLPLKTAAARNTGSASYTSWTRTTASNTGNSSSKNGATFAASAAAAATLLGGAASIALCEKNLKDPMTVYAVNAAKNAQRFVEEQENEENETPLELPVEESQESNNDNTYIAATSPKVERSAAADMTIEEARLEAATAKAKRHSAGLKLFSGNGNIGLSLEVAKVLGINLGKATVGRFADGEVNVMIHENVRGKDVYIIQPTCPPVNDNLMELLLMVSTLNRASARRITVVIPYYGYARQDRKMQARVPISAADVARLLEAMGIDRVIAVDLHCGQIQGFFGPASPSTTSTVASLASTTSATRTCTTPSSSVPMPVASTVPRSLRRASRTSLTCTTLALP